ncbi:MAG: hypothetical protein J1E81_01580 [Eubacterium sp.]|nr:hypothetical protein [Eubacterium sp.]
MKIMKTLGKIAGSAALGIAQGVTYAVEETSAAFGLDFITETAYDLRNKSHEKVAELWGKEAKELEMATGEKISGIIDDYVTKQENHISDYEKRLIDMNKKALIQITIK